MHVKQVYLTEKVLRVIQSCTRQDQIPAATKYLQLFLRRYYPYEPIESETPSQDIALVLSRALLDKDCALQ